MLTRSAEETIEYGLKFAKKLKGGEIIGLVGDLGGGKTTFVKGLAEGLKVAETITSPTFVILREYNILRPKVHLRGVLSGLKLVHIDAYRVETLEDIKSVGIEDYLSRNDVVMVIEWAEKIKEILPEKTKYIHFEHINQDSRRIA